LFLFVLFGSYHLIKNRHHHVYKNGLIVDDIIIGKNSEVSPGDTVSINYRGTLQSNGKQFDSSYDRGVPYIVDIGVYHTILGWDLGILGMKIGGKRKLTIPSALAYGKKGAGSVVPPNSNLIYEIELVAIQKKK
jgi:FKBP-type peptidyl-prolyl cis-trans isomerase